MSKSLVIYYSRKGENYWNGSIKKLAKGNTERVAEFIQKHTDADLFEVETVRVYDEDYYKCIEEARMMLIQGKGFMPLEGGEKQIQLGDVTKKIKLTRDNKPIMRRYCAFAKVNNAAKHTEEFIKILKRKYEV